MHDWVSVYLFDDFATVTIFEEIVYRSDGSFYFDKKIIGKRDILMLSELIGE